MTYSARINALLFWLTQSLLFACKQTHTVYEGKCQDRKLTFAVIEQKSFPTNLYEGRLTVGNLSALKISGRTMDMDVPYDLTLYQQFPHEFFDANSYPYQNKISFENHTDASMLYVPPTDCTRDEFNQYAACLKARWKEIKAAADSSDTPFRPVLIGMVYAARQTFIHEFRGTRDGEKRVFEIAADGYVRFRADDYSSEEGTNLSQLVQMPGRKIYLMEGGPFTKESLRAYRDEKGKSMEDYFDVIDTTNAKP